ncbi:tetratricopeptide repeat protein [Azospirillum lipoferum]|uniref:Tetratricopeptide repeat protein n=1 Tax=Azospirillum lipoferum TaxID=193 RepID=A0A5A9GUJ0_AZOLI|nr:tetratricopeptide repeat protein [Azospirillum lipoferum]
MVVGDVLPLIQSAAAALQRREPAAARRALRQALALDPACGDGWSILGVAAIGSGDAVGALAPFRRSLCCAPGNPAYARNLAACLKRLGRAGEAAAVLHLAAQAGALTPDLLCDLADLRLGDGDIPAALPLYRMSLLLAPDHGRSLNNLAETLRRQAMPEAATELTRLARLRGTAPAWAAAGAELVEAGRIEEAQPALCRSLVLDPADPASWSNLGFAHLQRHRAEAAVAAFAHARSLDPALAEAPVGQGSALMLMGRVREGAALYEERLRLPLFQPPRRFDRPDWDGRIRPGATLLIHADRGIGDAIQFIRYAPILRAQGMRVLFCGQESLLGLLRSSGIVDAAFGYDEELPPYDMHAHVMSLVHRMGTDLDSIPGDIPYLRASQAARDLWAGRAAGLRGLKIGIVWAGSVHFRYDRVRSPRLEPLLPLFGIPGTTAVVLQFGQGRDDMAKFPLPAATVDWGDSLQGMDNTAAALGELDVVVSSCTFMAHLAGALGRPVSVLLHAGSEWRWLREREESPWYPTARLYRQTAPGDWSGPVERLRADLAALAERRIVLADN